MRVDVSNGKYTVIFENGRLHALRHGEEWRDCVGDNLVYSLASELEDTREKVSELELKVQILEKQLEDDRLAEQEKGWQRRMEDFQ